MKNRLSRRHLMTGSLLGGASALTGCGPNNPGPGTAGSLPEYTVTLLCSGMLAIHWNKSENKLQILLPFPTHGNSKEVVHLVRFGGIGGTPLGPGEYRFDVPGFKPSSSPFAGIDPKQEVVFGKDGQNTPPLLLRKEGIFARIVIPNPTSIDRIRFIKKQAQGLNFFEGDAKDFGIRPDTLPATYALTFQKVTGRAGLFPINGTNAQPVVFPGGSLSLNVHLYSERPADVCKADHIPLFNAMFTRSDNGKMLNMVHDQSTTTDGDLSNIDLATLPENLSKLDLETLAELGVKYNPMNSECVEVADPAGCSNARIFG